MDFGGNGLHLQVGVHSGRGVMHFGRYVAWNGRLVILLACDERESLPFRMAGAFNGRFFLTRQKVCLHEPMQESKVKLIPEFNIFNAFPIITNSLVF